MLGTEDTAVNKAGRVLVLWEGGTGISWKTLNKEVIGSEVDLN